MCVQQSHPTLSEKRLVKEWEHAPSCYLRCNIRCPSHGISNFIFVVHTLWINFTNNSLITMNSSGFHLFRLLYKSWLTQLTLVYASVVVALVPWCFNTFFLINYVSFSRTKCHSQNSKHTHGFLSFSYKREPNVGFVLLHYVNPWWLFTFWSTFVTEPLQSYIYAVLRRKKFMLTLEGNIYVYIYISIAAWLNK